MAAVMEVGRLVSLVLVTGIPMEMIQPELERIDGMLVVFRFRSERFAVAIFQQKDGREISAIGDIADMEDGQLLSLYGRMTVHPKHGEQFRVDYYHPCIETGRDGVHRFLVEEVQGIGPAFAERIISYFYPLYGDALLDRLQEEPERLNEVPGLGESRVQAISDALHESYGTRRVLLKLYEAGVAPAIARTAVRYYESKGIDPVRVFEETPYQMVQDIPELSFDMMDPIARARGIPAADVGRVQAGIVHLLAQALEREGHSYLPAEALLDRLDLLFGQYTGAIDESFAETFTNALEVLRNQRYIQVVAVGDELVVYSRQGWVTEEGLARQVARILQAPIPPLSRIMSEVDAVRVDAEARAGIVLDPTQRFAFEHAMSSGVCIITGGPGTGKSTLARLIVESWEQAGLTVKLAAPTGRAARRLSDTTGREATTIHRLLEWREGDFRRGEEEPIEASAILIDEASMLDAPLALALCSAIASGTRLLLMGDVDQLPSVGPGNVLFDLIDSGMLPIARLTQIHRQDLSRENLIVNLAHAVNNAPPGQPIPAGAVVARRPDEGNVFLFDSRLPWARCSCGALRLPNNCLRCSDGSVSASIPRGQRGAELIEELVLERIPQAFGVASEDVQVVAPRYAGSLGVDELNTRLRDRLNPARLGTPEVRHNERLFRVGDKVMAVRNRYDKDVVNGLQGRIIDLEPGARRLTVLFDGEVTAAFKGEELDDLTLAYAITAHKAQGGEFRVALLALDPAAGPLLYRQLLYTAITRARDLLVLVGDPTVLERATANDTPRQRWTALGKWLCEVMGLEA